MRETDKQALMARVEELLKEQIRELGEDPGTLSPHDYAAHMRCEVHNDGSMVYIWREMPILRLVPMKTIGACSPRTSLGCATCISSRPFCRRLGAADDKCTSCLVRALALQLLMEAGSFRPRFSCFCRLFFSDLFDFFLFP